ncbi:MAG TPA: hypothetical protein VH395_13165, partial [Jatrophihabitantaceae bacterium]
MHRRSLAALSVAAVLATLAACGGGGDNGGAARSSAAKAASATAIKPGTAGGKLTMLSSGDIDYLDTGQTYYTFGYMV